MQGSSAEGIDARLKASFRDGFSLGQDRGYVDGYADGVRCGEAELIERIVQNLHKIGMSLEQIVEVTEQPLSEIKSLIEELNDIRKVPF